MKNNNRKLQEYVLGDVIEIYDHKRIPLNSIEREQRKGKYPYYGASGVFDYVDDYIFDGRYLLVAEDGENLRSKKLPIAFIANGKFWANNHVHIIKGKNNLADDYYLMYLIQNLDIAGYVTGAAQPKLSQNNLKSIKIYLPPLNIQKKIASALAFYDSLIENNTRRIAILEEMARSLYREWFINFRFPGHEEVKMVDSPLGPIPEGWMVVKLRDVCERINAGGTPSRDHDEYWINGTINWFKTKELQDGFLFSSEEKITEEGLNNSSAKYFERGSILMAIYAAPTVGRLGILTQASCCNQAAIGFTPNNQFISNTLLFYTLLELRSYFNSMAQGAAQQNISKEKVQDAEIVLPKPSIVKEFDDFIHPLWKLKENLESQTRNAQQTRDLLLPRLISGEIDVSNLGNATLAD